MVCVAAGSAGVANGQKASCSIARDKTCPAVPWETHNLAGGQARVVKGQAEIGELIRQVNISNGLGRVAGASTGKTVLKCLLVAETFRVLNERIAVQLIQRPIRGWVVQTKNGSRWLQGHQKGLHG